MPAQTGSDPSATVPPALPEKAHHHTKEEKPYYHNSGIRKPAQDEDVERRNKPLIHQAEPNLRVDGADAGHADLHVTSGAGGEMHAEAKKEPLAPSEKGAKKAEVQGVVVDDKLKKKVVAA